MHARPPTYALWPAANLLPPATVTPPRRRVVEDASFPSARSLRPPPNDPPMEVVNFALYAQAHARRTVNFVNFQPEADEADKPTSTPRVTRHSSAPCDKRSSPEIATERPVTERPGALARGR